MLGPVPDRALLELVGGARLQDFAGFGLADWARLARLAELHRLEPLLHWRHGALAEIPSDLRQRWRRAYRAARLTAVAQDADLSWCMALLDGAGCNPVALKGAFLARYAYPDPALRPMRDLDVLVPQAKARVAWDALLAAGCKPLETPKIALADVIRLEQHLPPLELPRGSVLELHVRTSELSGRLEYATRPGMKHR